MYNRIISIPLLVIGLILLILIPGPKMLNSYGSPVLLSVVDLLGIIFSGIALVWMFASLLRSMNESQYQHSRFTHIREYVALGPIKEKYKGNLLKEFKGLLTQEYPEYEKDLVSKFSFDGKNAESALVALAPALKTSEMYTKYASLINEAMSDILKNEEKIQDRIQGIQQYNTNPWYWFRIPVPADIAKLTETQTIQ